jgi:hypothetical protein
VALENANAPPRHVSPSSLAGWVKCGKRHQLQRVLGLKEDPAWWSIGGNGLHKSSEILDRKRFQETGK